MRNILIYVPGKKEKLPLSVTHPEIAKEADGWDPTTLTSGSGRKMLWLCQRDHSYEASVSHRTIMGSGCPYCSGKKVLKGFNDLKTKFPNLASEADGWDPTEFTSGSSKKFKWTCAKGHSYLASIANRSQTRGTGCPICSNRKIQLGFNDLATRFPEIAKQAKGWNPEGTVPGSSKKLNWECESGHQYLATPSARTSNRNSGCPICTNRKLLKNFNDLSSTHPLIAAEASGWDTSKFFAGSHNKLPWCCPLGHIYRASITNRTSHDSGCPICSGRDLLTGFNDLETKFPEIAAEANGWDPRQISAGTHKKKSWKCSKGHIYEASISHRTRNEPTGCSICAGKRVQIGFNDLSSQFPEIAAEADGWDPTKITSGIDVKLNWKCPLGHRYSASVGSRTNLNTNCPVCANMQLLSGFNDLRTRFPLIAQEAFGWDPAIVLAGSKLKMKWKCALGHIYIAGISRRTSSTAPTGCPKCGKYGFDSTSKGFLYLIEQSAWQMLQIGITNDLDRRLGEHQKIGWELLEIRGPMEGLLTQQWETAILRMLKAKGADLSNAKIAGKFDGYSEAWSKSTFEVRSIKELMQLTEDFKE